MSSVFAGNLASTIRSFDEHPDYVRPLSTVVSSATNSGWFETPYVKRKFIFTFSLPMNISTISDNDRTYNGTYENVALTQNSKLDEIMTNPDFDQVRYDSLKTIEYTSPTIFGRDIAPLLITSGFNYNQSKDEFTINENFGRYQLSDGVESLSKFNWFPFITPQFEFSYMYTSLKVRYIGVPTPNLSAHLPAFSLQHEITGSLLKKVPLAISIVSSNSIQKIKYNSTGDVDGTLTLDGFSTFGGLLFGKQVKNFHFSCETGWEYATLKTGGELVITEDDEKELVRPNLDIVGKNNFRAALTISVLLPRWGATIGQSFGKQYNTSLNILNISTEK